MDPAHGILQSCIGRKMAAFVHDTSTLVTFHRMLKINPAGKVKDLDAERQRMDDELYGKLSQIAPGEGSAGLAMKEALLYFAEQL